MFGANNRSAGNRPVSWALSGKETRAFLGLTFNPCQEGVKFAYHCFNFDKNYTKLVKFEFIAKRLKPCLG